MSGLVECSQDNLRQQHSLRSWLQMCGCSNQLDRRCNPLHYFGDDCHMFEISIVEENIQGALLPIQILKGTKGDWCLSGTVQRPPGRQRFALSYFEPCTPYLPFFHSLNKKPFNVYETVGDCAQVSDPANGWSGYVQIYSGVRLEQRRSATRTSRASQAPIDNQLLGTVDTVFRYAPLQLGASSLWDETFYMVDVVYDCRVTCMECGSSCSGCGACANLPACPYDRLYVLSMHGNSIYVDAILRDTGEIISNFVSPVVIGGCSIDPRAITIHDGFIVIAMAGASPCAGLYYAPILGDGSLGAFHQGMVGAVDCVSSCGKWLIAGGEFGGTLDGRIVMSQSASCSKVYDPFKFASGIGYHDIDCCSNVIAVVGDQGSIVVSNNKGYSWSVLNSPTAQKLLSVGLNGKEIWIGTDQGDLWSSCNNGHSWSLVASVNSPAEITLSGASESGGIYNISFANQHVGYFTSGNQLFSTYNQGAYWSEGCPRFNIAPAITAGWDPDFYYKAMDIPVCLETQDASNRLALGVQGENVAKSMLIMGDPIIEGMMIPGW